MKKLSIAVFAASLAFIPASLSAQEFDVPQNPPVILAPETVVVDPVTEPAAEEPVVEPKKAKKEKKVKEPKVKEVKEPKVKKEKYYGFCNHLGVGAYAGVLDGISGTVGVPLGSYFQVRGNYSIGVPSQIYDLTFPIDLRKHNVSGKEVDLSNTPVHIDIPNNMNVMLDVFLSKKGGFHLTVGLSGLLDKNIVLAGADIKDALNTAFPGQDPSSLFVEFNDDSATDPAKKQIRISPDNQGVLHLTVRDKVDQFRPYFGIGWGRVASIRSWLNLNLDLGVQKVGGFEIVGYDYDGNAKVFTSGLLDHQDKVENLPIVGTIEDIVDKAAAGELPFLKGFSPVIRLGLTIRLF